MPAISPELISKMLHPDRVQEIYDTATQPNPEKTPVQQALDTSNAKWQDYLNARMQTLEQKRTDELKRARINALGNALVTMVQPLGWAAGGATGGTIPYDNRQYLDAFNRSMKASDDIRSLADIDAEFQFRRAEEDYQRALNQEAYNQKQLQIKAENDRKAALAARKAEVDGIISSGEAAGRANYTISSGGHELDRVAISRFYQSVNAEYRELIKRYDEQVMAGNTDIEEPPTYEEFLSQYAQENGFSLSAPRTHHRSSGRRSSRSSGTSGNSTGTSGSGSTGTSGSGGGGRRHAEIGSGSDSGSGSGRRSATL